MELAESELRKNIIGGLNTLFARVVGQVEHDRNEVIYPEFTNNTPFFELTWDLNRAEDQDELIRQIIEPQMAELRSYLTSGSKKVREFYRLMWDQARTACLFFVDGSGDYDLVSYFESLLCRVAAPTDATRTRAFFRKVLARVFSEDMSNL